MLSTYRDPSAKLVRNDYYLGNTTVDATKFVFGDDTQVMYSCSIVWKNRMLVFGGYNMKRQVTKL